MISMVAAITLLSSCNGSPDNGIGLQLWSVRSDMAKDPVATIEKIGAMGYDYVEPADYSDGKFYGMEPAEFRALVENNGMVILGSHTTMAIPDSGSWEALMPWWDQCIAAHEAAGVEYIVAPSMGNSAYQSLAGLASYCEYFNAVGEKCNEAGIRFGYHNHDREFSELEGERIYDFMLRNTDPEKVGFQLDIYWIYEGGGDPMAYFLTHPDRFLSIHIKDEKELGESGEIDFLPILEKAMDIGSKYFVVEVERYNHEPLVSVEKSLDYLKEIGFIK
ncbi:MAG TPA: sugar phosphate isomerase/epimerase [Bacteroides sp.]|nr:sugar phosphate isomerase/epimerase [Bacteroides sp.]